MLVKTKKWGSVVSMISVLFRNHYVGRTFISPGQKSREQKVRTKFNPVKGVIEGRSVIIVDDSIVRGTTSQYLGEYDTSL